MAALHDTPQDGHQPRPPGPGDSSSTDTLQVAQVANRLREEPASRPLQLAWLRDTMALIRQLGDTVALLAGQWLGLLLLEARFPDLAPDRSVAWITGLVGTGTMLLLMSYVGLNRDDHSILNIRETQKILRSWLMASAAALLLLYLARIDVPRSGWLLSWGITLPILLLHRDLFWHLSRWLHRRGIVGTSALIYGTGSSARMLLKKLRLMPELGIHVVGLVDDDPRRLGERIEGVPVLGDSTELRALLRLTGTRRIYIALAQVPRRTVTDILSICRARGVDFQIVPSFHDMALPRIRIEEIDGIPLLGVSQARLRPWRAAMKRGLDMILGSALLALFAPLLAAGMLATRLSTLGPVIQRHRRVGRDGALFNLLRLRIGPRSDVPATRTGAVLHRLAIDAMPMLVNVIRGDLSLVGPRSAHVRDVARYDEFHRLRLNVRPGITGLWRILPHAPSERDDSLDIDLQYIHHQSLLLDLSILIETARNLVLPRKSAT